jgi:hypothetical protein
VNLLPNSCVALLTLPSVFDQMGQYTLNEYITTRMLPDLKGRFQALIVPMENRVARVRGLEYARNLVSSSYQSSMVRESTSPSRLSATVEDPVRVNVGINAGKVSRLSKIKRGNDGRELFLAKHPCFGDLIITSSRLFFHCFPRIQRVQKLTCQSIHVLKHIQRHFQKSTIAML